MPTQPELGKTTGPLIRAHRLRLGRSQESVAWACGITQSRLSELERGVAAPSPKVFAKLAKELGIPKSEIPERYHTSEISTGH